MTTNNGVPAATNRASVTDIDNVDTFAKQLYRKARVSGVDFAEVATVVRGVHTVLKHLKVEVEDPGSLLNTDQSPVYARQLTPIVEDCDFTLKQLDTILKRYGASGSGSDEDNRNGAALDQRLLDSFERDKIALIRTKLANQKLNIDMFLDTVQLHNPSKSHRVVETSPANLESIKDKVDAVAAKITQRRDSSLSENDDELWLQFRDELEKEGFSRDVLRNNQDVLRAYIRQLDEESILSGGKTPTVRGFLEEYKPSGDVQHAAPYPVDHDDNYSPKEMLPSTDNEKFNPSMRMERLHPDQYPPYPPSLPSQSTMLSYDDRFEDGDGDGADKSMALVISTRDLMALDKREADLAIAMDNMHLQLPPPGYPPNYTHESNLSASPHGRQLEAPTNARLLTSSPNLPAVDAYGLSPRFDSSFPPPPYGSSPPPTLHSNSISAPAIPGVMPGSAPGIQSQPQRYARLAPDSQGRDIPLDAQWTRIRRSLISPEVLNQAGVRYEARPEFVAILGMFTKDEIAEFARRSLEVRKRRQEQPRRAQRDEKDRYHPEKYKNWDVEARNRSHADSHSRNRANSEFSSSSTDLYDSTDEESDEDSTSHRIQDYHHLSNEKSDNYEEEEKGTKVYPFIVSPPSKEKENGHSPSATVKPKPILKNKNDDPHVRFDPEPKVLDLGSPRSAPRHGERPERRNRAGSDRDRHVPRSYDDREDRYRDRDRERDRDDEYRRHHRHHHDSNRRRDRDRDDYSRRRRRDDSHRDRDRYRDDNDKNEDRTIKKRVRGETLRAVGIGGAAASLLSVLTEAAGGL